MGLLLLLLLEDFANQKEIRKKKKRFLRSGANVLCARKDQRKNEREKETLLNTAAASY
jgi:hypothetical protein